MSNALLSLPSLPAAKHAGGRPTKYRPEMCERVVELMRAGRSKTSVACECGISKETLYDWCDPTSPHYHAEFSDAIKQGQVLAERWWEEIAQDHLTYRKDDPQINTAVWFINMKNRFGWRDKTEIDVSGELKIPVIEINLKLAETGTPNGASDKALPGSKTAVSPAVKLKRTR